DSRKVASVYESVMTSGASGRNTAKPYLCFATAPTEWVRSLSILAFYVDATALKSDKRHKMPSTTTGHVALLSTELILPPQLCPSRGKKRTRSSATFAEKYCPWGEFSGCTSGNAGRIDCHSAVAEMMMATLMAEFPSLLEFTT